MKYFISLHWVFEISHFNSQSPYIWLVAIPFWTVQFFNLSCALFSYTVLYNYPSLNMVDSDINARLSQFKCYHFWVACMNYHETWTSLHKMYWLCNLTYIPRYNFYWLMPNHYDLSVDTPFSFLNCLSKLILYRKCSIFGYRRMTI